jgi:hypothetical protein
VVGMGVSVVVAPTTRELTGALTATASSASEAGGGATGSPPPPHAPAEPSASSSHQRDRASRREEPSSRAGSGGQRWVSIRRVSRAGSESRPSAATGMRRHTRLTCIYSGRADSRRISSPVGRLSSSRGAAVPHTPCLDSRPPQPSHARITASGAPTAPCRCTAGTTRSGHPRKGGTSSNGRGG